MNPLVLILSIVIPLPLCLFRMKKYGISWGRMLLIYVVVSVIGALGACIGAVTESGTLAGKRLYGLMLFDTAAVLVMSRLLKMDVGQFGDFVAPPIMAVCFSAKIDCIVKGCCYGFTLYQLEMQQPVRFPSAVMEMVIWGILTVLMLCVERSERGKHTLWPMGMIWFGTVRFLVDFLRGSALEKRIFLLGLTGGQFWSLLVLVLGLIYLYVVITKINERKPRIGEFVKAIVGRGTLQVNRDL